MGFFSRLFQRAPAAQGQALAAESDDWTRLPEGNASELVLQGDDAYWLMAQFDLDAAIASHQQWNGLLEAALQGLPLTDASRQQVGDAHQCPLGRWLHTDAQRLLGHLPAFDMLLRRHTYFHDQAAALLASVDAGDQRQAAQAHKACRHASNQVVLLLMELQKGLQRQR